MYKPTIKDLVLLIAAGLGALLVMAFTDLGLLGAALVGDLLMLTVYLRSAHESARRNCVEGES